MNSGDVSCVYFKERVHYVDMEKKMKKHIEDTQEIIFGVQHNAVITKGTSSKDNELLYLPSDIPVIDTQRGGKYTLHSPGQLMIYPVLFMKRFSFDIMFFIQVLEQSIIKTLNLYGIYAVTIDNVRGVFIKTNQQLKKIAFIGIRISKGMSYYGLSVNISNDLSLFEHIVPCGLQNIEITSLKKEGINIHCRDFFNSFCDIFSTLNHNDLV